MAEPHVRLQILRLRPADRGWMPMKIHFPTKAQPHLMTKLVIGAYLDLPATDYAYVLIDNLVRIFSLGSGVQVRVLDPLRVCTPALQRVEPPPLSRRTHE